VDDLDVAHAADGGPRPALALDTGATGAGLLEDDHNAMLDHALIQSRRRYRA
jgi:hypothetical protein